MRSTARKWLWSMTAALLLICSLGMLASASPDPKPTKIARVGAAKRTLSIGQELDLKVKTTPRDANDDYLQWKIVSGSKYVSIIGDKNDDEVEIRAKKAGTAKIRCYIKGKTSKKVTYTIQVKKAATKAVGKKSKTVRVGDDVELEVKTSTPDRYLTWSITSGKKYIRFDGGKTGDDVEIYGVKTGTAKVVCKNKQTGTKITFTVKVKPAKHDDDDDD